MRALSALRSTRALGTRPLAADELEPLCCAHCTLLPFGWPEVRVVKVGWAVAGLASRRVRCCSSALRATARPPSSASASSTSSSGSSASKCASAPFGALK